MASPNGGVTLNQSRISLANGMPYAAGNRMANTEGVLTAVTYTNSPPSPTPEEIKMLAVASQYNLQTYFTPILNKYKNPNEKAFLILCMIETLRLTRPLDQRTAEIAAEEDALIKACNDVLEQSPEAEAGAVKAFMAEGGQEFATDDDAIDAIAEHIKDAVVAPVMFKALEALDDDVRSIVGNVQGGGALLDLKAAEAAAANAKIEKAPTTNADYKKLLRVLGINSKNAPTLNAVKAKMNVMAELKASVQKGGVIGGIGTFLVTLFGMVAATQGAPASDERYATVTRLPSATATPLPSALPLTTFGRPTPPPPSFTPAPAPAPVTAVATIQPQGAQRSNRNLLPAMNPERAVAIPNAPLMPPLSESQFKQQARAAGFALERAKTGTVVTKLFNALTLSNAQPAPSPYYDTKVVDMLFQATTAIRSDLANTPQLADYMTNELTEAVLTDFTKSSRPPKKIEEENYDKFLNTFKDMEEITDPAQITDAIVDIALRRPIEGTNKPKTELLSTIILHGKRTPLDATKNWFYKLLGGEEANIAPNIIRVALIIKTTVDGKEAQYYILLTRAKFEYLRPLAIVFGPLKGQMNTRTDVGVTLMGFLESPLAKQLDFLTLAAVGADSISGKSPVMTQVLAGVKSLNAASVQGAFLNYMNVLIRQSDDIIRAGEARLQINAPAENGTFREIVAIAPAAVESARMSRSMIIAVTDSMFGPPGTAAVATRITDMAEAKVLVAHLNEVLDEAAADPVIIKDIKAAGALLVDIVETAGGTINKLTRAGLRGINNLATLIELMIDGMGPLLFLAAMNFASGRLGHTGAIISGSSGISSILFALDMGPYYARMFSIPIAIIYLIPNFRFFHTELMNAIRGPQPGIVGNMYSWVVRATAPNPPKALLPEAAPASAPAAVNAAPAPANANAARRAANAAPAPAPANANAGRRAAPAAERDEYNLTGGYKRRSKYITRKRKNRHLRKTKSVRKSRGARRSRKN